jgi:hypothetical protein
MISNTAVSAIVVIFAALAAPHCTGGVAIQAPPDLTVDFSRTAGRFRPLHGINKGPLAAGGLLDLTEAQKALHPPLTRLHDAHWPNPDVVDMHVVFPDPKADPALPGSYDFRLTDEYVAAVRATGAAIIYRLGESIEHTSVKRFAHPPADPERWARAAVGIIRHYNEEWARGFRHDIRYWEIWNEPDNRPACWTGTDDEYFRLYRVASRAIKARFPHLKVGGPAVGNTGELKDGRLTPAPFVKEFLERCRKERLPLDFFSWHCYTDDPAELAARARAVRTLLDDHGFSKTESHLNEWNYLPDGSWNGLSRAAAAFIATSLLALQDAPVDAACLFHGEAGGFGLFSEHGVPYPVYHATRAFGELVRTARRAVVEGALPGKLTAGAGAAADGRSATLLVSGTDRASTGARLLVRGLPWTGPTAAEVHAIDRDRPEPAVTTERLAADGMLLLRWRGPAAVLIRLRPAHP